MGCLGSRISGFKEAGLGSSYRVYSGLRVLGVGLRVLVLAWAWSFRVTGSGLRFVFAWALDLGWVRGPGGCGSCLHELGGFTVVVSDLSPKP